MKLRWSANSTEGKVREQNEDYFLVDEELKLFIVCDGMGGHTGGRVASQNAAKATHEFITTHINSVDFKGDNSSIDAQMRDVVISAIESACKRVLQMGKDDSELAGMGTTLTLLMVYNERAILGHVGDSRLYMLRRGEAHQLSEDHTFVNYLIKQGTLTKEQAKDSPYSHVLTQCVGREETVQVDSLIFDLIPGDVCLLCSDGFYHFLDEDLHYLEQLLPYESLKDFDDTALNTLTQDLVEKANQKDGGDNITLVVVSAEGEKATQRKDEQRTEEVFLQLDTLQQLYLFEDLSLQDLMRVVSTTEIYDCKAGTELIRQGETGSAMYIILDGEFEVSSAGVYLATLARGAHFGEVALLSDSPRTATVKCIKNARLLKLERQTVNHLTKKHKGIGVHLYMQLARKLSDRLTQVNNKLTRLENVLDLKDLNEVTLT